MQTTSFVPWMPRRPGLFWAVGAYNRLVRLRSDANTAFAALESELTKQVQLVHACVPPEEDQPQSQFSGGSAFWGGLQGAAAQLAATLARPRPSRWTRSASPRSGAAQEVLAMAWDRAERDDAHDLAGPRLPENFSSERQQMVRMAQAATERSTRRSATTTMRSRSSPRCCWPGCSASAPAWASAHCRLRGAPRFDTVRRGGA
jgi:LemA protein